MLIDDNVEKKAILIIRNIRNDKNLNIIIKCINFTAINFRFNFTDLFVILNICSTSVKRNSNFLERN